MIIKNGDINEPITSITIVVENGRVSEIITAGHPVAVDIIDLDTNDPDGQKEAEFAVEEARKYAKEVNKTLGLSEEVSEFV